MEPKKRLLLAAAITVLIVGAMFTSFGRSLFALNIPQVVLPQEGAASSSQQEEEQGSYLRVEVTPETVQSVVAELARSESYYREVTVEDFWATGSSSVLIRCWVDGGWSHSVQTLPSGLVRHDVVGEGTVYYWYEGSSAWLTVPADAYSADLSQRLPTYETVLALDPADIRSTGYELRGERACVFVEVDCGEEDRVERYWIGVDSGLLVSAETWRGEELLYRMTGYGDIQSPCPADSRFTLPDGTVLHTP